MKRYMGTTPRQAVEPVRRGQSRTRTAVGGERTVHTGARTTHCPQGHEYSEANTYRNPNTGERHCRTCRAYKRKGAVGV